ncbi:triple gene block protein 1 [Ligustrum virus A]|uniref:Triple gene block protein 1 n=1 Tax=Ligustrum virus A TaxID=1899566 RepID=A0A1C9IAV4_9VIRU|nr:triple gene block protein 1 [Ligustrum virus A]AOO96600.1 triple gene block protein 1 [Ligustrum virus A]
MDILVKYLNKYNFIRLSQSIRPPVVIHCVPGAGKTSLIREIIQADSRFVAYTCGIPDKPNLEGRWIQKIPEVFPRDVFVLIDEYTLSDTNFEVFAVFGDPLQSNKQVPAQAHFICNFSHRFGASTAKLLQSLGYKIEAEGEDIVSIEDIFSKDPEGQIIYFEKEVGKLLCDHSVEARSVEEIVGQTYESVTFVTAENQPLLDPVATFQCLTRHRNRLLILCPNASFTSA